MVVRIGARASSVITSAVPGTGLSPDKMLLGRAFAYADAQRNRIGTNFHQLPVNQPRAGVPTNTYMFDGEMTYHHTGAAAVYAPNSTGRPWADATGTSTESWGARIERLCDKGANFLPTLRKDCVKKVAASRGGRCNGRCVRDDREPATMTNLLQLLTMLAVPTSILLACRYVNLRGDRLARSHSRGGTR
jgi:hypothetical protein